MRTTLYSGEVLFIPWSQMFSYVFRWAPGELLRAARAVNRRAPGGSWLKWLTISCVVGIVLLLGGAAATLPGRTSDVLKAAAPWLIVFAVWLSALQWFLPWASARQAGTQPGANGDIEQTIAPDGLTIKTVAATTILQWDHVVQVVETDEFLLCYYTGQCAYPMPLRIVKDHERPALRQALVSYVGSRATLGGDRATAV